MKRYIKSATTNNIFTKEERIRLFGEDPQGEVVIPEGFTSIGRHAFKNCAGLTSVTISNSVTSIGQGAFESCTSLTNVKIPDSVTSIDGCAFEDCTGLRDITIPDSVTNINSYTFKDCKSLTNIKIPNSVTSIGKYAFEDCTSLTSVTIPDSVQHIGKDIFSDSTNEEDEYEDDDLLSGFHSEDPEFSLAFEHDYWFIENKMDYATDALSALGYLSTPSTQGNRGIDEIYDSNDNLVATLDFQEELQELQDLYYQSNSEDEYISKLKQYYKRVLGV